MNIFVLDNDPITAAKYHCDKHVSKMILESAQMLSTALWEHNTQAPYKPAYKNHPCTIWARQTRDNFMWLVELATQLGYEFVDCYHKKHKSSSVIEYALNHYRAIPKGSLSPFAQAMPDQYKCQDAVKAYRAYYLHEKKHILEYRRNNIPPFLKSVQQLSAPFYAFR